MQDPSREKEKEPELKTSSEPAPQVVEFDEDGQLSLSKMIGNYEVLGEIGSGGMGKVYKARDKNSKAIYAIKVLKQELTKDTVALKRFQKEIEATSKLNHLNLVSVYDHGELDDGSPYFVMDLIQGLTLGEFIKKDCEIASTRAIDLFIQICEGLNEAHKQGVIHRDLKPSNILLTEGSNVEEIVKLADFGIARVANDSVNYTQTLTDTAEVIGSPKYMSPEQCAGNSLDARSDIYSLGCVMYEVLTKSPPFKGSNSIQIILKQINELPEFFADGYPKESQFYQLNLIIDKCLFKEPSDRYESMEELIADLKKVRDGEQINVFRKSNLNMLIYSVSGFLLVLLLSICFGYLSQYIAENSKTEYVVNPGPTVSSQWQVKSESQMANEMQTMAFVHFKKRSYKQALPALKYVAETHKKSGNRYYEYFAYQCIGQCYLSMKKYKEAEPWYEKAVNGMLSMYDNKLAYIDPETRSGYIYVLRQLGKDDLANKILLSMSNKNLRTLESFYRNENLPEDANRVKEQKQKRKELLSK